MSGRRILRYYGLGLLLYGSVIGLYVYCTRGNAVPPDLRGTAADPRTFLSPQRLADSETYSAWRNWLFFIGYPWEWGVYIVLLFSGAASRYYRWLKGKVPLAAARFPLYAASIAGAAFAAGLPWRVAAYALSRSYGITTQPFGGWLRDKLVGFGVDAAVLAAATAATVWLLRRGGRWQLKLWLLSVPFTVFLMIVQPVVVDPLFDKFTRLEDPALERDILQLAARAGVPADRVYEVHMAGKTNAMNAYVNGVGPTLRIVLWDTTLRKLERDEVLQVMAHEIGHYVMHHLEWSAAGTVCSTLVLLWIGGRLLVWAHGRWGRVWGIERIGDAAIVPALLLIASVLTFAALPLSNGVSRRAEHAADDFALRLIGSGQAAVTMNQKMAAATLDIVDPPLLIHLFRDNHPSDMERIRDAETYRP
jgi:STE24 endopeptidase